MTREVSAIHLPLDDATVDSIIDEDATRTLHVPGFGLVTGEAVLSDYGTTR